MSERRKLLPELLPDPKAGQTTRRTTPRERVLRKAERMIRLTAAATGGAVIVNCGRYGVVDPIPPPCTVEDLREITGRGQVNPDRTVSVELDLSGVFTRDDEESELKYTITVVQSAELLSGPSGLAWARGGLVLALLPDSGVTTFSFHLNLACGVDFGAQPPTQSSVLVTVTLSAPIPAQFPSGGPVDAGLADAGTSADAGSPDAGVGDGGVSDAGSNAAPLDAGFDSGISVDVQITPGSP
jgi:hypothetical protein